MFPAHLFNYFSGFYDKAKSHGNWKTKKN
jgi:hypothetical protein